MESRKGREKERREDRRRRRETLFKGVDAKDRSRSPAINAGHRVVVVKHELAKGFGELRLSNTRWP